jgi:RHS repeat-associated protein
MYLPAFGRFLNPDPLTADPTLLNDNNELGDALTAMKNRYAYCDNNPVNRIDPSGLQPGQGSVGSGGCRRSPPPPPPDIQRLNRMCYAMMVPPPPCDGCTVSGYQQAIQQFQNAVSATWIANICGLYVGTNTCQRWAFDLQRRLPNFDLTNPCVRSAGTVTFSTGGILSSTHVAYRLEMCDGSVVYADNGAWGGSDHIFYARDIPSYACSD